MPPGFGLASTVNADLMTDLERRAVHRARAAHVAAITIIIGFHLAGLLPVGHLLVTVALLAGIGTSVLLLPAHARTDAPGARLVAGMQGAACVASVLVAMHGLVDGHAILMSLYMLALMMSPSTWNARNLGWLAATAMTGDLVVFALCYEARLARMPLELEALRWLALGLMLVALIIALSRFFEAFERLVRANEQIEAAAATIRSLVTRDDLTGIFNRRHLVEVLDAESVRQARHDLPLSVCLLDIDHFKRVNDTFGHAAGDAVLREVAQAVAGTQRPIDVFGRYGGEEFLLVLPHQDVDGGCRAAERIRSMIAAMPITGLPPGRRVTVSIGVAGHRRGAHWQDMVNRADAALYRAKANGRNRVEVDPPAGAPVAPAAVALEAGIASPG